MTPRVLAIALTLLPGLPLPHAGAQPATKDDVARLLRIAAMTEWVTQECGERYVGQLKAMLLLTAQGTLRAADADDVEKFRTAVREHAFTFKSRRDACRSATEYLKSVQ
ncbi:hypothetical protein [Bosea minatitlanensis]|uniref:TIGR02301 family protein n=1 Tax=Bosea minatitlanensis TaxID=128782 RepID=A0ABW0EYG7_9HYPH|nr:hypothetical protein [Bosea minatitlanensis]MCT4495115.1 hypothetical protein [Bosea minatitlanensis]